MNQQRKIYWILGSISVAAYGWLVICLTQVAPSDFSPCIIKQITGYACPSCGTTRAVMLLIQGDFAGSLLVNPLGYAAITMLIIVPPWLLRDYLLQDQSFHLAYSKFEFAFRQKWIYLPAILLMVMNWTWNIFKGI